MKFVSKSKAILATLVLAALAGGAQADTIRLETFRDSPSNPYSGLYAANVAGNDVLYNANVFEVQNESLGTTFLAFCIEQAQGAMQGTSLQYIATTTPPPSAEVRELYDRFYEIVPTVESRALAFQLALWELLGQISIATIQTADVSVAEAAQMVDIVRNGNTPYAADLYDFVSWSNDNSQDILQAIAKTNEVPEPQTPALVLGGLGLMALSLRARRRKSGDTSQ